MMAQGISNAEIKGHECTLTSTIYSHISVSFNYTYQEAIDKSEISFYKNNFLPHRPVHTLFFNIKTYYKRLICSYEFHLTGANFRDRVNSDFYYIERKMFHNVILSYKLFKNLIITGECKNILDEKKSDIIGYPLPGRSFYGSIQYKF